MAVQAYILVQTEVGKAAEVATAIAAIDGVTLAEDVTGPYDVLVRAEGPSGARPGARGAPAPSAVSAGAEGPSVDELGALVVTTIQNVPGITRTLTCPIVRI